MELKKIEDAIEKMADQTRSCQEADKAIKYSQAALNLAQTLAIVKKGG